MTLVKIRRDSLVHAYAMELFSLFIFALAGHIREVRGTTTRLTPHGQTTASNQNGGNGRSEPGKANTTTPRQFENSLFEALAKIAVDTGICPTQEDARLLVIPAFAWYGLLPEPEDPSAMKTDGQPVEDLPNPRTDVEEQDSCEGERGSTMRSNMELNMEPIRQEGPKQNIGAADQIEEGDSGQRSDETSPT
ncbi:hypothetical protein QC761_607442 [Podospora bellae-mahoneyi]|uniref:Uncharacterized protein n=1 Tax=Podospora bellae-mahoneyi TaxID=2093777 RepID=A0ABR0FCI9_9PEZI|nr:hypothetical protein QC761_607442 [Podospora bellae-mahoneyi]